MIVKYGTDARADGECEVLIDRQFIRNAESVPYAIRETWTLRGFLEAASQAALTTALATLKDAYSRDGLNLGLYLSDGTTLSAHSLNGTTLVGGTRVLSIAFPTGAGAEYTTWRNYEIVVEGEYEVTSDPDNLIVEFSEVLSISGGGPRFVYLQPIEGLPQKQLVATNTPYLAILQGRAVGLKRYPVPPSPLWAGDEDTDLRRIERTSPTRVNLGTNVVERDWETRWFYQFRSINPLIGLPRPWMP